jgi:hypothetical protein
MNLFELDSAKFSVIPDLIRHPVNQLLEFTWIALNASLRAGPSPE